MGYHYRKKRKINLCPWNKVYSPREIGGLGLRQSQFVNYAFMSKTGWRLINDNEELWPLLMW